MKLIFAQSLVKREKIGTREKEWLSRAYQKGIYELIKGESLPVHSRLIKLYMTTIIGARRAVFLVNSQTGDAFFLLFRSKKDPIGENISIKNPKFKTILHKYLQILSDDLTHHHYDLLIL